MAFNLPAKLLAWNRKLQTRCPYGAGAVNQAAGDVMYQIALELITTRGFTCKGSSTGAAAGMDGVFRWTGGNDAKTRNNGAAGAMSWVVITLAGGRGDVVFSYNAATDDVYNVWWSPSGVVTVAGTATFEPTAADQVLLNKYYTTTPGTIVGTATAGDRLVSIWSHPSKYGFKVAIANGGAWTSLFGVTQFTPDQYGAGITMLDVSGFYINGGWSAVTGGANAPNLLNASPLTNAGVNTQKRFMARRTDGGGLSVECAHKMKVAGVATAAQTIGALTDVSAAPGLQGGAIRPLKRFGLYSVAASPNDGDVGTLIDWYIGLPATSDGNATSDLSWIVVENSAAMFWDWDGATAVVMT